MWIADGKSFERRISSFIRCHQLNFLSAGTGTIGMVVPQAMRTVWLAFLCLIGVATQRRLLLMSNRSNLLRSGCPERGRSSSLKRRPGLSLGIGTIRLTSEGPLLSPLPTANRRREHNPPKRLLPRALKWLSESDKTSYSRRTEWPTYLLNQPKSS